MGKYCFGIDVGGTSVKCGLFQTDGVLVEKWEIPTRKENSGEAILPDIAKTILAVSYTHLSCPEYWVMQTLPT